MAVGPKPPGAIGLPDRNFSQCDSLLIGNKGEAHGGRRARVFRCRHGGQPRKASTFPYIEAADGNNQVEHEARNS